MIIVKLRGGLGNQLFQYALGRKLAVQKGTVLKLEISDLKKGNREFQLSKFNTHFRIATKTDLILIVLKKYKYLGLLLAQFFYKKKYYSKNPILKENSLLYNENIIECLDDTYLVGYWQSEKYFKDIEQLLREEITLRSPLEGRVKEMMLEIEKKESVCIHVRAGDYIANSEVRKNIGVLPNEYYCAAVDEILKKVKNPHFFIFSDDINSAKKKMNLINEHTFVDVSDQRDYVDLYLMSRCKHFITANSSFSWWAAWLSPVKEKKVYVPEPWCKNLKYYPIDIYPESWRKIKVDLT